MQTPEEKEWPGRVWVATRSSGAAFTGQLQVDSRALARDSDAPGIIVPREEAMRGGAVDKHRKSLQL